PDVKLGYQTAPPTTINSNAGWLYTQLSGAHTPLESTIFYQDGTGNAIDLLSTVASFSWPVGTAAGTGNYVGNGNGTTTYFLGTMPGTGGSGNPVGFVTDGVERARVTAGGAWCFNCTVPGTPVQISDTSAGVPLRIVGPNPGGVGVAMQFYEGATSAGQITAANGGGFSFASPASTPINFYNSPTLMFQLYQSGADSVGAFQGAGEWVGVVTGAVGLPASNKGRLIYDKTLQHFYASENGGAYTQLCLAGGSCGSGGGTSWLASSTVGGTNANTGTTYIGGNNTAAAAMAFVTNGVDRGRITGAGLWGINTTTPGRVLESSDTSGGIPLRLTGIATGGAGVAVEFYETSTSAGLITVAKNNVFAIAGVGATPVTLNSNSNLIFKAYNSGGDSIGQFLGGAEWFGVVTGAVGVSPANKGRLIYDSTLQHFYFSENGGAYAQLAGGGGSGWPIGTAAGSGVYNNPGAGPYFLGLLNTGTLGFSTNSAEAMRITASQQVLIGSTSVGSQAAPFLVSTSGVPIAEFNTTGANGQIFFESSSGTVRGYLTASNAGLTLASFGGAVPLIMMTNSTEAARFDVSQRLILGSTTGLTTGGVHRETIKSSDYGQLGLLQSAGGTSRLTLASTIAAVDTAGGELAFDTNNFLINTAGSAGASLILGTGASRTPMVTLTTGQVATFNVAGGSSFVIDSTGHPLITMKASGSLVGTVGDRGTSGNMSLHNSTSGANVTAYASAAQVDIIHGSSTTSFVANNGVVFPSCSFGSFPTGAIGTCVCTNCKNSSQDGTVSGATCQSGSHNALAFYNGNSTVCN
ncbi:MAG TPA: hypothetical protein VNH83_12625, partial [Bryobacteraceae bacterium]|nr:hypothetical protein [Bryobacteraceae bacterium]